MSERLHRLAAIVRADFLVRFRRPSTAVVFLLMSAAAYLWVPDPSTGRALMQVAGRRAIYNSAAIGMATAMLGTIFIGLFGYYVVSNALKRDVVSRCGFVIASTSVRGSEYIFGKFLGNVVFLTVFMSGFMVSSMIMQLVRGEAPLRPLVFTWQYLLMVPPTIVFVSAVAITFESLPLLRGRFGDVFYFIVWMASVVVVAVSVDKGGPIWMRFFDVSGFSFALESLKATMHTNHMSIGASGFDATKPPIVFNGLSLASGWLLPRIVATLLPLPLLLVARTFFHRFDPARVRAIAQKSGRSWSGRLNAISKPFARVLTAVIPSTNPAAADARMTIAELPLIAPALIGFAIAAISTDVLPIAFAAVAIAIADIASREKRAGTTAFAFASPHLRRRFVLWKFTSALLVATLFLAIPAARAIAHRPAAALPILAGLAFTCAAATALGIISGNPKTFIVGFLSFFYVVMNDKGATPSLDFAGFFGAATPPVIAAYAAASFALLALAHGMHVVELRRRW
jgi:hypothetical protein